MCAVNFIYLVWKTGYLFVSAYFQSGFRLLLLSSFVAASLYQRLRHKVSAVDMFTSVYAHLQHNSATSLYRYLTLLLAVFGLLSSRYAAPNKDLWQFELIFLCLSLVRFAYLHCHTLEAYFFLLYNLFFVFASFHYRKLLVLLKLYAAKSKYKIRLDELLLPIFCRSSACLSVLCCCASE